MKVEGRKIIRRSCTSAHTHTYIFISYPDFPPPSTSLKTPYGGFLHLRRREIGDWLSAVKPNPRKSCVALRRRRRRWNVKSDSTTADVTNDRSRGRTVPLPCKPLQCLKYHMNAKIYIYIYILWFRGIDWEWRTGTVRNLHMGFAFVSRLKETRDNM